MLPQCAKLDGQAGDPQIVAVMVSSYSLVLFSWANSRKMPYISYESYRHYLRYKSILKDSLEEQKEIDNESDDSMSDDLHTIGSMESTIEEEPAILGYMQHPESLFLHPRQYVCSPCLEPDHRLIYQT